MKKTLIVSLIILLLILSACSTSSVVTKDISATQLSTAISTDSLLVVLDVRKPSELSGEWGQIKNAINIPVDDLEDRLDELTKYKQNHHIAVVCRSGNRSKRATVILTENGFDATNVLGGMKAYSKIE